MTTSPTNRRPNRRAAAGSYTVTRSPDRGDYRATITIGHDILTGKRIRKNIRAATETDVRAKADAILQEAARTGGSASGDITSSTTLDVWAATWLQEVRLTRKLSTYNYYELAFRRQILPAIGHMRLSEITPEKTAALLLNLATTTTVNGKETKQPVSAATRKATHRSLRACLGLAVERGHIPANPAKIRVPEPHTEEVIPLNREEMQKVLEVVAREPDYARWLLALIVGMRQGEVLGLQFSSLDLEAEHPQLLVRQTAARMQWLHGCAIPATCGKSPSKCPSGLRSPMFTTPKSRAGRRTIVLPDTVAKALAKRRAIVAQMRLAAGPEWEDNDLVFPGPSGITIDYRSDNRRWHKMLEKAGVRQVRLHDSRHSAASINVSVGTPERVTSEAFGWGADSAKMLQRYQHVLTDARADAANKVEEYMFGEKKS